MFIWIYRLQNWWPSCLVRNLSSSSHTPGNSIINCRWGKVIRQYLSRYILIQLLHSAFVDFGIFFVYFGWFRDILIISRYSGTASMICGNGLSPYVPINSVHACIRYKHIEAVTKWRFFPGDIFKCIFMDGNFGISIRISLKLILKIPINNKPALVQMMTWRRPGDEPLSEPMMV